MTTAGAPTLAGRSVLVTGGAGFIGSHLTDRLAAEVAAAPAAQDLGAAHEHAGVVAQRHRRGDGGVG